MNRPLAASATRLVLVTSLWACGGDARVGEPAAHADPAAATDSGPARDTSAMAGEPAPVDGDTSTAADSTDPFAGFRLPAPLGATEDTSRIHLLLRNDAFTDAVVYADGGAGEVLLDTVPAESSVRVDLVTRARVILLRSASPGGDVLRSTEVEAGIDSVVEIMVGRAADSM